MPSPVDRILNPARFPFFYGWVVVGAATLGIAASIPGQTMGVSVFAPRLEAALGLSNTRLSLAYGIGTVTSGLLLVRGGYFIDRFGVRRSMILAAVGLGVSLALLAVSDRLVRLLGAPFGEGARIFTAMLVTTVAFFLIRFLGQGIMTMTSRVMIGKWFNERRGLAVGISGVFAAFSFGSAPWLLSNLIAELGWRGAYAALAAGIGIGMAAVAGLFSREQPEDYGLAKDGKRMLHDAGEPGPSLRIVRDFTLGEARRNYAFWVYTLGLGAQGMVITAFTFHVVPIGAAFGQHEAEVVRIFLPMALLSVFANLSSGWISDRIPLKYLLIMEMVMLALATLSIWTFGSVAGRALVIVGFGLSGGICGTLVATVWPRYFGTLHLGAISGQNMSIMVLMTAGGPLLFAESVRLTGGYGAGLVVAAALPVLILFAAFRTRNPQDRITGRPDPLSTE